MEIKTVTITKVYKGMQETKFGDKPKVAIKTQEYGDKYLTTFKVTSAMDSWKEGDKVTINVEKKGDFLNFTMPSAEHAQQGELLKRVERLEMAQFGYVGLQEPIGGGIKSSELETYNEQEDDYNF